MISSKWLQGQSSFRRGHVWLVLVASVLGTFYNILSIATHPYEYMTNATYLFGALAAFSVWVLALGVKKQLATVREAKVALWLVIVWLVLNVEQPPSYYKTDNFIFATIFGVVVAFAVQLIPIMTYAHLPFSCLWTNRIKVKQALLKEAAIIAEREEQTP
jgi:uncharacterized membrane protein